jgi:hypothetical protein
MRASELMEAMRKAIEERGVLWCTEAGERSAALVP